MNGHILTIAGLVVNLVSVLVAALVAYLIVRVRADLSELEASILRTLTEYVRKEDCRDMRARLHDPRPEESACSP